MIKYEEFVLDNGLRVMVHEDASTPLAAVNILYDVGARDEEEDKTGFAHLFEHLMFGGSKNIKSYDEPLQRAGGENNAFTNNDITNYYITLPAENLETAFWLESDRMLELDFSQKILDIQKNVVTEEFKQRYLNQPYGDIWLLLRPLAYKVHPYRWPTIGKDISHIEKAKLEDVRNFFYKYYRPNNAIMVVAGNVKLSKVKELSEKWFADIEKGPVNRRDLPKEPEQTVQRKLTEHRNVPVDALYLTFHGPDRRSRDYHAMDLLTDVLSNGHSSRLYRKLVKEKKMFSELHGYQTGQSDENLIVIEGKLAPGVNMENAETEIWIELEALKKEPIIDEELTKVKNKIEATIEFSEMSILNKAMNLAYYELLGNADDVNREVEKYRNVTSDEIKEQANKIFKKENNCVLYYLKNGAIN
jgi:zinc protease